MFDNNENLPPKAIGWKELIVRDMLAAQRKEAHAGIGMIPVHSTIEEFIDSVKELVDMVYKEKDIKITLKDINTAGNIMENPHVVGEELSGIVLYEMLRRAPGTMAGGNDWFSSVRREIKPRIRMIKSAELPEKPYATVYMSQWHDNLVCFKICAKTAYRANQLALEFESMMESYRFFFGLKGVNKYFFNERTMDVMEQMGNESYYYRPLEYYVRTESTYTISENAINKILLNLAVASS